MQSNIILDDLNLEILTVFPSLLQILDIKIPRKVCIDRTVPEIICKKFCFLVLN